MIRNFLKLLNIYILLCFASLQGEESSYEFMGHHFLASYGECDPEALVDLEHLEKTMEEAVKATGATVVASTKHFFSPNGFMMVLLLSESHASIHTYPEHNACFVDCFTCGHSCDSSKFDEVLTHYLKPKQADRKMFLRNNETRMITSHSGGL